MLLVLRPKFLPGGDRGLELLLWLSVQPARLSRTAPGNICYKQA
jgi:hypothetical protein